jgi:predicted DNA-binding antitoxin AbrB/MazE fold protein
MSLAIPAIFEDGVFRPLSKIDIPNHQRVVLTVKPDSAPATGAGRWHWAKARAIDDGYAGEVSAEVVRQRREA